MTNEAIRHCDTCSNLESFTCTITGTLLLDIEHNYCDKHSDLDYDNGAFEAPEVSLHT